MDKKDIYEHLAKIYLDASAKRKKKTKEYPRIFGTLFFASLAVTLGLSILLSFNIYRRKNAGSEISLVLLADAVKINFNFDPAKKEIYSLNLNKLDLTKFKVLGFAVKKENYQDNVYLRVEFTSNFKEKSEIYIKDVSTRWRDHKIKLSDFKNISDWSQMLALSFIVEQWNVKEKKGVIFVDNIRLLR